MADWAATYPTIIDVNPYNEANPFCNRIRFIHNQTKDLWIDLKDYDITHELDLNPIPLLTAIGNGYGGGDYGGTNEDVCGSWAGDVLQCYYNEDVMDMPQSLTTGKPAYILFASGSQVFNPKFVKLTFEES